MKKILLIIVAAAITGTAFYLTRNKPTSREAYEAFLRDHEYTKMLLEGNGEGTEGAAETDRPDLAFMQEFLRTMDPNLKRPSPEVLFEENIATARFRDGKGRNGNAARSQSTSLADATQWEERGPSLVGGRTRAMLFDPADAQAKKVWAGGVSGGLWYNDDITNASSSWIKVDDFWDNLSISCIAADPNNDEVIYVGTGEAHLGMRGGGIWKTTNGGDTWAPLPSTSTYLQIRDIAVRNESGNSIVYAAVYHDFNGDDASDEVGLYRSTNGGSTWNQVLPIVEAGLPLAPSDIEIGDDEIWVGAKPIFSNSAATSVIYRSSNGTSWTLVEDLGTTGQVELAVAPSDADVVYAVFAHDNAVEGIKKTSDNGDTWADMNEPVDGDTGIPADDFSRGQAWYDLTIAVHPTNTNEVIVGGIDLFRSTNGGTSWTQISEWWINATNANVPVVHADQHEILYRPGFPDEAIFGNDGGVYYADNLNTGSHTIQARNENYNVTQFYTAALHPTESDYMLGGTQDNGTQKFTLSGFGTTSEAYGGDGAMCFIDQLNPQIQIVSYVFNNIYLSTNGGGSFTTALIEDGSTGNFINVGEYDPNMKILYTARTDGDIYRISNITSTRNVGTIPVALGSMASAMRLSPFSETASNLYVGTDAGRVFRIQNAHLASPVIEEITGPGFPTGSVSGISFGASEDQILVTFFNYGVVSIWETRDGGQTWLDREGNLPNMPVRWVEYHPHNPDQAYIATQLGVWSTDNINVADPVWNSTNGGLANVRTDMLRLRKSDGVMMAATHGRGVFTALIPAQLEQEITFSALTNKTFGDAPFNLTATSTSELEVTFESSNPAIASVTGNTVTIHAAGTVTITANQVGNIYYAAADPVGQSFTINKAPQTITFNALADAEIDDAPFALTATATSGLTVSFISSNPTVATVVDNMVTVQGVGTTTITARQSGNTNYLAAPDVPRELEIVSRIIQLTGDMNFGEVIIGESGSKQLTISNTGTAELSVGEITYPEAFSGTAAVVGGNIVVTVSFAPTDPEDYTGNIVVSSNATSGINTMAVFGTGIAITSAEEDPGKAITVYPNPALDRVRITAPGIGSLKTIRVTDASGKAYTETVERESDDEVGMTVSDLPAGVYILAIPLENRTYHKKITKN